jgi:hypothetical protein
LECHADRAGQLDLRHADRPASLADTTPDLDVEVARTFD